MTGPRLIGEAGFIILMAIMVALMLAAALYEFVPA